MPARWLPEEEEVLKKFAGKKTARELAKILNRSPASIANKMYRMNLEGRGRELYWSEDEVKKLKEIYPFASRETLEKEFPQRSYVAITRKAYELGLKKTRFKNKKDFNNYIKKLRELINF